MNDIDLEPVLASCHYDLSPETIFDAWVKPDIIRKWLFVGPSSRIVNIEVNPIREGYFSILECDRTNGEYIDHYGKYKEIERPYQIVFTLYVPKHFAGESTVTIHIFPTLNGCELKLTQVGVPKEVTEKNWIEMLHHLKTTLEEQEQ
ncbi:MAG: SRPBCC family protein [Ferruginibacter sp.]